MKDRKEKPYNYSEAEVEHYMKRNNWTRAETIRQLHQLNIGMGVMFGLCFVALIIMAFFAK